MTHYRLHLNLTIEHTIEVDALTAADAEIKARELMDQRSDAAEYETSSDLLLSSCEQVDQYAVELLTEFGWAHIEFVDDEPVYHESTELAQKAIDEVVQDVLEAFNRGDISSTVSPDEYRIVKL